MKLKFCGIRRQEDIEYANQIKPDYIGFILAKGYRRTVEIERASILRSNLDKDIKVVGVFVNQPLTEVLEYTDKIPLDIIQLHGDETMEYISELKSAFNNIEIWKAVRVRNISDIEKADELLVDKLLLDSFSEKQYGGTGKIADWEIIKNSEIKTPFFLAGGLNTENIQEAIERVMPYGVDISGGIETDSFKDYKKMKAIAEIVRSNKL